MIFLNQFNEEETSLCDVLWLLLGSVIFVPIFQKLRGGRIVFRLYGNTVAKTVENFRALCTVMKKSKQAKASEGDDGVDFINNLPDHVLQSIISHIPTTEEVVRTSILSRRWRFLWTSIPSIDIDVIRGPYPLNELDSNKLKEFVYWVLLNKPQPLDSFRLWFANYYNMSTISLWIHAAVLRKVKLLDMMFRPIDESEDIELPHYLVTCGSVEVLRLCLLGYHLCLPKIIGFPALRVLELNDVELKNGDLVKYFLESCPLLEDLTLLHCYADDIIISCPKLKNLRIENPERIFDFETEDYVDDRMSSDIQISCPKLVFLNLTGSLAHEFLFENLFSLKKAVIHITDFYGDNEPTFDVFEEISHVESLSISLYCVGRCYYSRGDDPISLPNLKTLEITVDAFGVLIFLKCLPSIESLHLIFVKDDYGLDMLNLEEAETINILTRHLKKVEFLEFDEEKPKLVVARALLEHGNELKEMVFSWDDEARFYERSMETMKEVSNFHKASSTVKLRFVINPSQVDSVHVESSSCSSNSNV